MNVVRPPPPADEHLAILDKERRRTGNHIAMGASLNLRSQIAKESGDVVKMRLADLD